MPKEPSNYPPGVTGNEPEIAGEPEEQEHDSLRAAVLDALWSVKECPDSSERERACRSCEATAVTEAVTRHLLAVLTADIGRMPQ